MLLLLLLLLLQTTACCCASSSFFSIIVKKMKNYYYIFNYESVSSTVNSDKTATTISYLSTTTATSHPNGTPLPPPPAHAAATKTNKTNMKVGFYSSMIHPYLAALLLCVSSMRKRLLLTAIITVSFLCNHFSEGRRIPSYTALLMEKRKEKLRGGGQDTSSTSNSRP